jgi:predicted alpha/beta superfamily hydrolase
LEEKYADTHTNLAKKVFLSVGSKEFASGPQGMIENTRIMFEKLKSRNYTGLDLSFKIFKNETHVSVVGISIQKGIETVFK